MGDPTLDTTYIGPLTLPHQVKVLETQVKDAVTKGATVLLGGVKGSAKTGNWFQPTVLVNVNHTMGKPNPNGNPLIYLIYLSIYLS